MDASSEQATRVLDYLYLGGRHSAKDKEYLDKHNIRYILNMTPPRDVDPRAGVPNFFKAEGTIK